MTQLYQTNSSANLNDPKVLYLTARKHYRNREWGPALALLERLVKSFPDAADLRSMRDECLRNLPQGYPMYRQDPLYQDAQRTIQQSQWATSAALVGKLVDRYPLEDELRVLHNQLLRRHRQVRDRRTRRWLTWLIMLLGTFIALTGALFLRYLIKPAPLMAIVAPQLDLKQPPHYLFSIYNVEKPIGVGVSPDGKRIYVSEAGGERQVKIFDQEGKPVRAFAPPHLAPDERAPVYLAVDPTGRVFVADRLQRSVFIFSREGGYQETLVAPDAALSKVVSSPPYNLGGGRGFAYNLFQNLVYYIGGDGSEKTSNLSYYPEWAPLGVRFAPDGRLLLTDVLKDRNAVYQVRLSDDQNGQKLAIQATSFGASGDGNGQFMFPNSAVMDAQGRVFVSDGNNRRVSAWDAQGKFLYNFGGGGGDNSLSLPRGLFIDAHNRLYVVDAVGQDVKVYDISKVAPIYLFSFGDFGVDNGSFNYPNDIAIDLAGRLYIVDRENNRVQVWTY